MSEGNIDKFLYQRSIQKEAGIMKRVLVIVVAIILSMGIGATVVAQVDDEDCWPLPNLESATKCETGWFLTAGQSVFEMDDSSPDFEVVIVIRIEYKSKKTADKTFDEIETMAASPEDETDEIPLKPTNDYKRIGISDALQGEEDGSTVVILRDDKAIVLISGNVDDDLRYDLIKTVIEEDTIPEEIDGLEPLGF